MTQTPPVASVDVPPSQPTVAWQPVPGPQTGEPVIAPAPEGYPQQSQYAQPAVQYNEPLQQPVQPQQPYYAPAAEQPAQNLTTLLRRNNLFSNRITQLRRNSLRSSRIMPLRQNNRWQVTPGKPKSSNPLLLHSLHTRLSKLISSQPLRSRCTNSRNLLNSSLLWSLSRRRIQNPRVRRFTTLKKWKRSEPVNVQTCGLVSTDSRTG